ncbi:MAG: NAD-dependent DNA ligase LigA [Candidatus Shapirobacteria bacterium]
MITLESIDQQNTSPEELGEILIKAKKAYYTGGNPIMDDHTYDTLEDILRKKQPNHRIFSKVGNPNFDTGFTKKNHTMPMGSQNKVTNITNLIHYFELKKVSNIDFVVQPKCDGISVELIYKDGNLVDAITRGDGQTGDLITQNIVKMKNLVLSVAEGFTGSVRCEIMVTKKDFKKLPPEYSNPRNAASGISQRLDSKFCEYCSLYAVDIFPNLSTISDEIDYLKSLGFTTVESLQCQDFDQVENIYQDFLSTNRLSYPFEIDGLVIKINSNNIAKSLGEKNNRPKHQVAYKFPASTNTSTILNIEWQVGPMGAITPVAQIEPIELSGAIVTFASLANHDLIIKKNINIGDIIEVTRRGDVIPHIEKVITKVTNNHTTIPTHCPSCKTLLIKESKLLRCPNTKNCLPQIIGSLNLFCHTLDILGLSDKTIQKLYDAKKIQTPGDFYKLTTDDIAPLDNLGEKSAKNIIVQIQNKKILTLKQVFDAAIIPNFSGARIQQLIIAGYDSPNKLLNLNVDELIKIKGFQKVLAKKIIDGINLRREWIESILINTTIKNLKLKIKNLEGKAFCITGTLSQPRQKLIDIIESNGGKFLSSVTSNTNYLICNEKSNSDKYQSALKLNIPIITEEQFSSLM